jgi:DNA adenine methylase
MNICKPFLKWVGGKTQILNDIVTNFPTSFNNYHEIFLGGGSVLLGLLTCIKNGLITMNGTVYAYDYNEPLIFVYKNIQTMHNELYITLNSFIQEYQDCPILQHNNLNRNPQNILEAKLCKENYYFWLRNKYNCLTPQEKKTVLGSALFIFLNKTCFRGMYRQGPNGFNVSFGNYNAPQIINKFHLDEVHDLIQNVIFQHMDFSQSLSTVRSNDFVYLDPPYAPINNLSFVKYTEDGFNIDKHLQLFNLCHTMNCNNIKFMMSNADVKLIRDNFCRSIEELNGETDNYKIVSIDCRRRINSRRPETTAKEVIITNF